MKSRSERFSMCSSSRSEKHRRTRVEASRVDSKNSDQNHLIDQSDSGPTGCGNSHGTSTAFRRTHPSRMSRKNPRRPKRSTPDRLTTRGI